MTWPMNKIQNIHPLIRLEGLSKSFALPDGTRFDAVKNVSLQIREG